MLLDSDKNYPCTFIPVTPFSKITYPLIRVAGTVGVESSVGTLVPLDITRLYFQSVPNHDNSLLVFNGNTILKATSHYKEFSAVGYLSISETRQILILSNLSEEGLCIMHRDSEECICGAPCFCLFASHFKSVFSDTLCGG